jgi:acyl carrier protein
MSWPHKGRIKAAQKAAEKLHKKGDNGMWDAQFEVLLRDFLPFLPADTELSADLNLREFGLDSLGVVDLLVALESAYDVRLTDDVLSMDTFTTPAVLWDVLSRTQQAMV